MILYIDPGTGSMLFAIVIGIASFLVYFFRGLIIKIKYIVTRGRIGKINENKIPLLIFAESKRYWMVFRPIIRELDKHNIDIEYWTTSEDDPAFAQDQFKNLKPRFIGTGNRAFAKLNMANATIIIASTPGLNVYQWKRSKLVDYYIHVQHGANDIAGYRMFGTDYFDASLLSGQYQVEETRELEAKRDLPAKDTTLVGIPYMDDMRTRLMEEPPVVKNNTCVLLAPSWGNNSIFNKYGPMVLEQLTKTGYDIIVRPHPQSMIFDKKMMDSIIEKYPESDKIKWDFSSDNFKSLHKADILISDFSGIIFDFTLAFDKPVIYTNVDFNPDCYDYYWLDRKPWTLEILPKLGLELNGNNLTQLKELIDKCLSDPRFSEGRDRARQDTWVHMGEGAVRTSDFIIQKYKELTSS